MAMLATMILVSITIVIWLVSWALVSTGRLWCGAITLVLLNINSSFFLLLSDTLKERQGDSLDALFTRMIGIASVSLLMPYGMKLQDKYYATLLHQKAGLSLSDILDADDGAIIKHDNGSFTIKPKG